MTAPPRLIRTGADLRAARHALGWTTLQMADALRLVGTRSKARARVHTMEMTGDGITGPVSVAVEAILAGFRPAEGWFTEERSD